MSETIDALALRAATTITATREIDVAREISELLIHVVIDEAGTMAPEDSEHRCSLCDAATTYANVLKAALNRG